MIHSTKDAGPKLRYELYKAAMKVLKSQPQLKPWGEGWTLIRARGKWILENDQASDSECAEAIIMQGK